jgi:hypothetical protein
MRKKHLSVVQKPPGNAEDWRKVEVVETFIAAAKGGSGWALELIVDACDKVIAPSDTTTRVYQAYLATEYRARGAAEQPENRRRQAVMLLMQLEDIDRRFVRLAEAPGAVDALAEWLGRYDPAKKSKGVDGILAKMILSTGALDLAHDKHGGPRDEDEIRNVVSKLISRRRP